MSDSVLGFDLGGSQLRTAVFTADQLCGAAPLPVIARQSVPAERSPAQIVELLVSSIRNAKGQPKKVGIGFAGMMAPGGRVERAPNFGWIDVPLQQLLQAALGSEYKVVVENDVNAATLGECRAGGVDNNAIILGAFCGTGFGGGLVINNQIYSGATGCAIELGHVKVVVGPDARRCGCGKIGCIEAYVGGAMLRNRIHDDLVKGVRTAASSLVSDGEAVEISHIDQAAIGGDGYASALWSELAPLVGLALANAATLVNPSHLILGGGVFLRCPNLAQRSVQFMRQLINPPALTGLVVADAVLGDDAGVVGAANVAALLD